MLVRNIWNNLTGQKKSSILFRNVINKMLLQIYSINMYKEDLALTYNARYAIKPNQPAN